MTYKALYRKYRPKSFVDVVGQDAVVQTIINSIREGKVSHAYLLSGPRGSGKTSIAKLFAKSINCLANINGTSCNVCSNCLQIENENVSDIIEIDAASNNGVDEIRELRSKVNLLPSTCKYKIYIIDEVHMLSTGAFNALLKTLEEPPAHVIFILATTEPHKLPITVISRCQRFDFKKISNDSIEKKLADIVFNENISIEDNAINLIAKLSDGGLRDAIGLLDQASMYTAETITINDINNIVGMVSKQEIIDFIINLVDSDVENVLHKISDFEHRGKNLIKFVEELIYTLKNGMVYLSAPKHFKSIESSATLYELLSDKLNGKDMYVLITVFDELLSRMMTSGYQQLLIEVTILNYINNRENRNEKRDNDVVLGSLNEQKNEPPRPKIADSKNVSESKMRIELSTSEPGKMDGKKVESKATTTFKGVKTLVNMSKLETIITIRVNNTFAEASKEELLKIKKAWERMGELRSDDSFELVTGMLQDAEVKVAGSKYLLVVFKYQSAADCINENLVAVETILTQLTGSDRKVVAISDTRWNEEKNLFISKTKNNENYLTVAEDADFYLEVSGDTEAGESTSMIEMLGDIVEMK